MYRLLPALLKLNLAFKTVLFLHFKVFLCLNLYLDEFDAEEMIMSDASLSGDESNEAEEANSASESIQQPTSKKQKKSFNPEALASAFQTVLRQKLPSKEADSVAETTVEEPVAPILSRRKAVERNIEEEEIDKKARKILKAQIRESQDAMHISDANLPEMLNYERSLRKLATRGVVHLFNSIRAAQVSKEEEARARRQAKLDQAYENLPLANKNGSVEQADTYFEFLKQQQQLRQQ